MANTNENIQELKRKTDLCMKSRKHANAILDIIALIENDDDAVVLASIKSLHKIFSKFISKKEMHQETRLDPDDANLSKEDKYKLWLLDRYHTVLERSYELLSHTNPLVQETSLSTLMKFVVSESKHPLVKLLDTELRFPVALFSGITTQLLNGDTDMSSLISRFVDYFGYDDVRFFTVQAIVDNCRTFAKKKQNVPPMFLSNVFALLEKVDFSEKKDEDNMSKFLTVEPEFDHSIVQWKEHKRQFSAAWLQFLRLRLTTGLYRKVLIILHDKVMPYMTSPLMLSDFLTESYNIGGAISLLALNGVFILVHKYNLDYPDFYKKLYALLEPSVFHVKYRARFFHLANLFLTSTHLPAYLVAAFVKRLSRLCLTAPVSGLTLAVPIIYNLIIRHPSCKQLINCTSDKQGVLDDPYSFEEPDPAKSNALESSLWEIKSLQNHYYPNVASMCQKIEENFPKQEIDVSELLETSADDLYDKETKRRKLTKVPLTFEPPRSLLSPAEDRLGLCWTLT